MDVVIVIMSLWVLEMLVGYGGIIGGALRTIGIGTVIIGVGQLVETIMSHWFGVNVITTEFVHRLLLITGFIFIVWGYRSLMMKK